MLRNKDRKLTNTDVNNAGFNIFKICPLCKCFMRKEIHSSDLKDARRKTSQSTSHLLYVMLTKYLNTNSSIASLFAQNTWIYTIYLYPQQTLWFNSVLFSISDWNMWRNFSFWPLNTTLFHFWGSLNVLYKEKDLMRSRPHYSSICH